MAVKRTMTIDRIAIHHPAVAPGAKNRTQLKERAAAYNRTHATRPWASQIKTPGEHGYKYIEYHYLVARNGEILQLQDEKYVLYHAGDNFRGKDSFNLRGVAVCIDGNYQYEKPTEQQKQAVARFIHNFKKRRGVFPKVKGHKEVSANSTSCPGKNIGTSKSGWLKSVVALAKSMDNPAEKPWYEECVDIGLTKKIALKNTQFIDIDTKKIIKKYPKGSEIQIKYQYEDYYITPYSFDNKKKNGFLMPDWRDPEPTCEEKLAEKDELIDTLQKRLIEKDLVISKIHELSAP